MQQVRSDTSRDEGSGKTAASPTGSLNPVKGKCLTWRFLSSLPAYRQDVGSSCHTYFPDHDDYFRGFLTSFQRKDTVAKRPVLHLQVVWRAILRSDTNLAGHLRKTDLKVQGNYRTACRSSGRFSGGED